MIRRNANRNAQQECWEKEKKRESAEEKEEEKQRIDAWNNSLSSIGKNFWPNGREALPKFRLSGLIPYTSHILWNFPCAQWCASSVRVSVVCFVFISAHRYICMNSPHVCFSPRQAVPHIMRCVYKIEEQDNRISKNISIAPLLVLFLSFYAVALRICRWIEFAFGPKWRGHLMRIERYGLE